MTRPRVRRVVRLVPLAAVLLACGCGSASTPASTASAASAAAGTPSRSTAPLPPASTTSAAASGSATQFCAVVKQQLSTLQGAALPKLLSGGTPEAWKAYLAATATMNQQLVDAAPADIRASVTTLQTSTRSLATLMAAAGYDPSKVGSAKLIAAMRSPASAQASLALTGYAKSHCEIDLTKPAS